MGLPDRAGHRHSFADSRDDGRRMEVTWHADAGVLVISLWQDATCRSTFRMPIEDAPALIGVVTSALGEAVSAPQGNLRRAAGTRDGAPRAPRARIPATQDVLGVVRRVLRRRRAEVVPLHPVKRRPTT